MYLVESPDEQVKVSGNLAEFVSSKYAVDQLHLLCVCEQVPIVDSEMCRYFARSLFLREGSHWLCILVRQRRLCV